MTILVWDGKTLACDSMLTYRGRKSWVNKFWKTEIGIFMGCGKWTDIRRIIRALQQNEEPREDWFDGSTVIQFDLAGKLWIHEDHEPQRVMGKDAWGSGRDFALGALSMGATAEQAVKIACQHSTSCGGKIHTFTKE